MIKIDNEFDFAKEYIKLPILPTNTEICIDRIEVYNFNYQKNDSHNLIKYSTFTSIDPVEYTEGKNKEMDYMPNDYVSPIIIVDSNDKAYKVNDLLWFPLSEIEVALTIKQYKYGNKILPKKIYIDEFIEKDVIIKNKTYKNVKCCDWVYNILKNN